MISYKIIKISFFIAIFSFALLNEANSSLKQVVKTKDGTSVLVKWANQFQLDQWIRITKKTKTFKWLTAWLVWGANRHNASSVLTSTYASCANWASVTLYKPNKPNKPTVPPLIKTVTCSNWYHKVWNLCFPDITNHSCRYIASWNKNWSNCDVWIEEWNSLWEIKCKQKSTFTKVERQMNYTCVTWSPCISSCPGNKVKPNPETVIKIQWFNLNNPDWNCTWKMADWVQSCDLNLKLNTDTNQNKSIIWIVWNKRNILEVLDKSEQSSDWTNSTFNLANNNALDFSSITTNWIEWNWINFNIKVEWIKAISPFQRNDWKIQFKINNTIFLMNNINYSFNKPFVWQIEVTKDNWNSWTNETELGTLNKYRLSILSKSSNLAFTDLNNFKVDDYSSKVWAITDDLSAQDTTVDYSTLSYNSSIFESRINTSSWATTLKMPGLEVDNPYINYVINNNNVKYNFTESEDINENASIKIHWKEFLWIEINWRLEWDWKSVITWQVKNISEINKLEVRAQIHKNAYINIKNRWEWIKIDNIIYFKGDKKYSDIKDMLEFNDTIIIEEWNFVIDENIDVNIWIIVLSNSYSVETDYSTDWNIYINNNVTKINSIIYADWWLISSKLWNPYIIDSIERTLELQKQLIINWNIFSRNTIWWAILAGWNYILPWWKNTSIFNNAMIYDLNYLRKWTDWCSSKCDKSLIINYNWSIQNNPPKLFKNLK